MAQPVGERGEFGRWVDHFNANEAVHAQVDAAIDFDSQCRLTDEMRRPLIASVRRFQLGESGDGQQLMRNAARSGDFEYLHAIKLFVGEEQQHAALLLRLLGYLGGTPMQAHWSDAIFVRLRRLMGLRTELMVLTVAEVVALSYYGGLATAGPDSVIRAVAQRIVDDENAHVRFQRHRLRAGFADSPAPLRLLAFGLWWLTAIGATVVVAVDHGRLLDAIGYRRIRFVRDVLSDFAGLAAAVLSGRGVHVVDVITSLPASTRLSEVADRVRRIEELGFDTVHVSETVRDPFAVCALALEHSSTLTVRTSMVVAFARSPMVTACAAWELARYSGGRFQLGIATQVRGNIVGRFSMPWTDPVAQLRDYVASLRAIFAAFADGRNLDHRGSHYTFTRLQPYFNPGPLEVAPPAIWTGGVNRRMCTLAGTVADGFVAHPTSSHPAVLREYVLPALAAGAAKREHPGGGPQVVVVPRVICGHDEAAVATGRDDLRSELAFLYSTPAYQRTLELFGLHEIASRLSEAARRKEWSALAGVLTDDVVGQLVPQGTYAELPGVLASWYDRLCDGIALDTPPDPGTDDEFAAMIGRIKEIPAAVS